MPTRLLRSLTVALVALAFACSSKSDDEGAPPGPNGDAPPSSTPADGSALPDGTRLPDGGVIPGLVPNLTGVLKTNKGAPAAGVLVRVLDYANAGQFAVTDAQGAFAISQVATPYDLHLGTNEDYLGLSAAKLDLRTASSEAGGAGLLRDAVTNAPLAVTLPNCGGSACTGRWVIDLVGDLSAGSYPSGAINYPPGSPPATLDPRRIVWRGPAVISGTIRVWISDVEMAHYFYGEAPITLDGAAGTSVSMTLGSPLAPVALTTAPATVTVDRSQLLAADTVSVLGSLYPLGSATGFTFGQKPMTGATPAIVAVPQVAGASMKISAQTEGGRSTASFSGPIATSTISLSLTPAPEITAPVVGDKFDESAVFSWKGSAPNALYEFGLLAADGRNHRRVFSTTTSVALSRLLALDGAPGLGNIQLSLTSVSPVPGGIDGYVAQWSELGALPARGVARTIDVTRVAPDAGTP